MSKSNVNVPALTFCSGSKCSSCRHWLRSHGLLGYKPPLDLADILDVFINFLFIAECVNCSSGRCVRSIISPTLCWISQGPSRRDGDLVSPRPRCAARTCSCGGYSPAQIVYGRKPRLPPELLSDAHQTSLGWADHKFKAKSRFYIHGHNNPDSGTSRTFAPTPSTEALNIVQVIANADMLLLFADAKAAFA